MACGAVLGVIVGAMLSLRLPHAVLLGGLAGELLVIGVTLRRAVPH